MSTTKIADIVAGIPYGSQGKKRWRNVGALLQMSDNDPSKGPGFIVVLDSIFNPAGLESREGQVLLSCFHPNEGTQRPAPPKDNYRAPKAPPQPDDLGDDIPF